MLLVATLVLAAFIQATLAWQHQQHFSKIGERRIDVSYGVNEFKKYNRVISLSETKSSFELPENLLSPSDDDESRKLKIEVFKIFNFSFFTNILFTCNICIP